MISNVPELLKPLFVCMGVVKANDVIDFCYSPDLMCGVTIGMD